jgi:hypothetical protein
MPDSITDGIRKTRRSLAAQFGNDLDLILEDIRRRESSDGRRYVTLPPRSADIQADEPSVERESPVDREFES